MNDNLRTNMSVEDTENNNVDENSNDHHFDEFADYHHRYTNHQFRRHVPEELQSNVAVEQNNRVQVYEGLRNGNIPGNNDIVDSQIPQRRPSSGFHRRNMSEDLLLSSGNLPPLPRNPNCVNHEGLIHSNREWLPPLYRRRPNITDEEVQAQGRELLYNFAAEQFREEDLNLYDYLQVSPSGTWKREGRNLRLLADEFSRSQERRMVRNRAQSVHMDSLTCENFFHLCYELFRKQDGGGITQERIVVLFTFISDIAIQQVRQRTERFLSQLMEWSLRFIFDNICAWVREAGGWGVVLSRGANICYKVTIFVFAAVSIVALGVFIKKNWKDL